MKKIFFSIALLLIVLEAASQTYSFDSIPGNLRRRADAVIRSEQCLYTIIKPGHAVEKVKNVVTLLNENSIGYRYLTVMYDKFSRVNYIKGIIYDEKGKIIKALGMLDVIDMSAMTGNTFYSDDRMKVLYFPIYKYPYTIEYEYEIEYSSILSYPSWKFQDGPDVSVERSGIQFIVPKGMILRYYAKNLKSEVDSVITADSKIYTWQAENLPAMTKQNYTVKSVFSLPEVHIAPLDFDYGGYKGSMSSWKTFGAWQYNLNQGLDILPQSELTRVSELISKTVDPREKVKLIYEYVQSKTRYVSIQIGVGGWRPADASSVAKSGFGDCKALTNYMLSLLKAVGINSYYTLVMAGKDGRLNRNFVDNQFNHAILCVPMKKDTVWLDCTSQTLPFNYLGDFTDDRYALIITPEGGKIVRTPEFKKSENIFRRTGSVTMYTVGATLGKISNNYQGYNYGNANQFYAMKSEDELKRYLYSALRFPDFGVSSVSYTESKSEKPSSSFSYGISINNFTLARGSRIYFNPSVAKPTYLQDFPSALEIVESEILTDSISYYLPFGYKVEFLPADVILENDFGKYRYQLEVNNDKVIYKRYLEMNKGVFPIEKFNEFRNFVNVIANADMRSVILTKGPVLVQ